MSIYVVATYDLAGSKAAPPDFIARFEVAGTEVVSTDYEGSILLAEERGVTLVLEFASKEAAQTWAGEPEWSSVRQAWLHPIAAVP